MIEIPEAFVRTTVDREQEPGAAWIAELPGIVDELTQTWGCEPDGPATHGGVGLILPVRRPSTGPAVLKVSFPHPGNVHEPDAYAAWQGRGAVHLYERDDARFAMLLERAHSTNLSEVADGDELASVAGRLNHRLAVPAPAELPRLSDRAAEWEENLLMDAGELSHTMPEAVVAAALATVRELGRTQPETLVHGDLHARNILRADREPWLAVDPKGYVGDPAYDGGTLLKSRALHLIGADDPRPAIRRILAVFAEAAELDLDRVRRWAQFHAVTAAFWGRRHGFRVLRSGPELDRLNVFADRLAEFLAEFPAERS
ncbi:aminoglycoside phosphotransferase family protein [Kitasatospora sp. NPDC101183]|uniref:aminoglycoside phosphotransferase family protein n=1 Tax=Kitasatospora sp. NPDC101183 TaxID=3364100 RepID=UPI00381CDEBE